jgi:hypothetical protein
LRWIVPLTIVIAGTAIYALSVRTNHYGLTVERVWAFVVAGAALIYAVGYSIAAFERGGWLARMSQVNVIASLALIAVIACALTPILSPYRLSANSQYHRALLPASEPTDDDTRSVRRSTPFEYLRFDAGRYGMTRLQSLAAMKEGPNAAHIARLAREALGRQYRWQQVSPPVDPDTYIDALSVFPEGRNVDAELALAIAEALKTPGNNVLMPDDTQSAGLFIDLNGNGDDEFVILTHRGGMTFARTDDGWSRVKTFQHRYDPALWKQVIRHLAQGEFDAVAPSWKDLQVGSERIRVGPPD